MAHDVFICYSSKDKTTADAVCAVLESEGIRCWIAPRDILVGMSYGEAIVDAIHNAKALVLVFSGHANQSPQIEREVERAINHRIPVIPLRIEDVAPDKALEYFLSTPHWLDAFTPPLDRHLRNLAGQIRRLIGMPAQETPSPSSGLGSGASPFKNVEAQAAAAAIAQSFPQTPEPAAVAAPAPPPPVPEPPKPSKPASEPSTPLPAMGSTSPGRKEAGANATLGVAAFPGSSTGSPSGGSVPPSASKSGTSPAAFFNKLDTNQKVGIGAVALVVVIGLGWAISGGGGSSTPTPMIAAPGVSNGPGSPTTADGKHDVQVGPNGQQTAPSSSPQVTDNGPQGVHLPSDGDVIPGRPGTPGPAGPRGPAPTVDTSSGTAMSADGSFSAATGSDIARVLSEAGYDAQAMRDNDGDPMIQGTIENLKFAIYFYRCNKQAQPEACMDLQFHSVFTNDANVGEEALNKYNRDNRFGQAFFMQNGDIGLDMSATLQGGVTRQHIKEVIDWWKVTLTGFTSKIGG